MILSPFRFQLTEMGDNSEMISVKSSDYQTRDLTTIATNENNWCWVGSLIGNGDDIAEALKSALDKLSGKEFVQRICDYLLLSFIYTYFIMDTRCYSLS